MLQTLTSNPKFANAIENSGLLNEFLEDMGFGGLWRSCTLNPTQEADKSCFGHTEKLIEVSDDSGESLVVTRYCKEHKTDRGICLAHHYLSLEV